MSAHRESFAHRARNLLPLSAHFDFPIPDCSKCRVPMVKLEGQWGCKDCSKIETLIPVATVAENGRPVTKLIPNVRTLGDAYPNRAARRSARRTRMVKA